MTLITEDIVLEGVEHILGSGTGTLDFAVEGETGYFTWHGDEDADWEIEDVDSVVNTGEDRFEIQPETVFTCEISANGEENNDGPVRCWCE